ncbi:MULTISPECIES: hypothetical protein [unclassified Crossiella]|uniref:hypothetical protein n=1 Tax=unclassified Crossiella TaxID=2620835 RepID=UPI0020005A50|nr:MULTISPECIES: hypothetical protein [unclassified Crossiella]MCK2236419.1 hypothetical protein [Crossiella sp. S99.2]MCK2250086.1 hypothetical protein [Crossiella sp. S99.1]
MSELRWDEVADLFDPDNGVLPDVEVAGTTVADWQTVFDLVRARGWEHRYNPEVGDAELPAAAEIFAGGAVLDADLHVWPAPDVMAIFRFYRAETVDFDVHLEELQGQGPLDVLCEFYRTIGRALGKSVVMTFEGHRELPMIGYDVGLDRVIRLAPPD